MSAILLFALFATCCLSALQFQCSFQMRDTDMTGGFVNGRVDFDWTNRKVLHTFTTTGTKELFSYGAQNGYGTTAKPFDDQYKFTWAPSCGCKISSLLSGQPTLNVDTGRLTPGQAGTTNTPSGTSSSANPLVNVVFDAAGFPVSAKHKDGRSFSYTGCTASNYAANAATFVPPSGCTCGKPIDIVLVLDRSSSIDKSEFILEKEFTMNLVNSFAYSALEVNLGITNFHTLSWDGPVDLAQGNTLANVQAGASALQCAGDPSGQCRVSGNAGSCCGSGTSISSGIINGADMLAAAPTTGIRSNAAKVLIVLTDGYHNKILKRTNGLSGDLVRDGDGKPSGVEYKVQGQNGQITCGEDANPLCVSGLNGDLTYAVNYAKSRIPGLQIFAIGVGDTWKMEQLTLIADNKPGNVLGTTNWNELTGLVDNLVLLTCQQSPDDPACVGCCGFCACSGCVAPDGCDPGNFCDNVAVAGTCCKAVAKPPSACTGDNKCKTYSCDRTGANGAGSCKETDIPVTPTTMCAKYECVPATGLVVYTDLCPPQPKCKADADCADDDFCTDDVCVNPGVVETAYCKSTAHNCEGTDKCYTYTCSSSEKTCKSTIKPIHDNDICNTYTCVPATGLVEHTSKTGCEATPACTKDIDCNDNNACTIDTCVDWMAPPADQTLAKCVFTDIAPCNTGKTNLCETWTCDPASGCKMTPVPVPETTKCTQYDCIPATGVIEITDLCPPQPACTLNSQCDDLNACTVDECVLEVATDPLSAKCVWTARPASYCDDSNACTRDSCIPATGCSNVDVEEDFCEDNDACTTDSCDPASTDLVNPCKHEPVVCEQPDICHQVTCDALRGCLLLDRNCPVTDNCTISGCNTSHNGGCYVESAGTCGFPVAAAAGIAAGAIAGIVCGVLAAALLTGGGAAYAFTHAGGAGLGSSLVHNPLYEAAGSHHRNPLNRC